MMVDVWLVTDWSNETILFYNLDNGLFITQGLTITTTLENIPQGNHTITVTANRGYGSFENSSSVNFAIH